ncbi:hypothetical protein R1sor_014143 [Riccia sorocarpa]|uniref:Uncharacterized protein n=1 Tax=Riccia sorocarpa TaxID=122646 RepID=A0ABD3HCF2_9MARC
MRQMGAGAPLLAPYSEFYSCSSAIHCDCQKRLLDLELNLDDGVSTFSTLQWALSELERLEEESAAGEADVTGTSRSKVPSRNSEPEKMEDLVMTENQESERVLLVPGTKPSAPRSSTSETEKVHDPSAGRKVGWQNREEPSVVSEHIHSQSYVSRDELSKGDLENWRDQLNLSGRSKRKSPVGQFGIDGEKRAKVREFPTDLRDAVISAVEGEAGNQMSQRISSRLKLSECVSLTGLITQCLVVSLDQTPADSARGAVSRTSPSVLEGVQSGTETGSCCESLWLHRWLVRSILHGGVKSTLHAKLDWLVAYLCASHSTIIRLVLDDLVARLRNCEVDGHQYMYHYVQRTGILEYAALREPELTAGTLLAMFRTGLGPTSVTAGESLQDGNKRPWPGFHPNICLGISVLFPKFFSAFTALWVPTLSADVVKAWSMSRCSDTDLLFLPAVWKFLGNSASEEPKSRRTWLCAAMVRRLPELAPVASHIVLLMSALCDATADCGASQPSSGVGYYLLGSLYKVLSKQVLPSVLGPDRDNVGNDTGVRMFLENLQDHAHLVWREVLEVYSVSRCPCCDLSLTVGGHYPAFRGNNYSSVDGTESEGGGLLNPSSDKKLGRVGFHRGCLNRDPLIQVCQLLFLCSAEHVVADLLASATRVSPSSIGITNSEFKRMLVVKKMMQLVVGQGRGCLVLELWAERVTDNFLVASDEQALRIVWAVGQLLDLNFWRVHRSEVEQQPGSSSVKEISDEQDSAKGQEINLVWKLLRAVLDAKWLSILTLMHRNWAWDLRLAVLGLLQQLPLKVRSRSQVVAKRLKGVLGLYFSWLETLSQSGDVVEGHEDVPAKSDVVMDSTVKSQYVREMEHLKRIIIQLASCGCTSFTMMLSRLLDFSFEHCQQMATVPSATSPRAVSTAAAGSSPMELYEENSRIQSDDFSSLHSEERERFRKPVPGRQSNVGFFTPLSASEADNFRKRPKKSEVIGLELGNLLRRTFKRALSESAEASDPGPYHPVSVMISLMTERLETPHEVLMTMEQYEEVLPKHISSLRHIFVAECFSQNSLLLEMLELVVKHGNSGEVLRCVEFVRVLLADCISRWHSTFRTRRSHSAPPPKVDEEETRNRMQVHRLIQLVASAGWLPPPLASSGEVVAVIDGADIADLLLLVWRCMHHAVAFGTKGWGESSANLPGGRASVDGQGVFLVNEEAGKEGTYTEWESHYFSILRQNVAQIGPHFAQVYPLRKAI